MTETNKKRAPSRVRDYEFTGEATASVTCRVEAASKKEALAMVEAGNCEWECDQVDGDVTRVELVDVS